MLGRSQMYRIELNRKEFLSFLKEEEIQKVIQEIANPQSSNIIADLQNQLAQKEEVIKRLMSKISSLKAELNEKDNLLTRRFPIGWKLFLEYKRTSEQTQQLLSGVFAHDVFESFICSGAQDRSIGKIWDVIKNCLSLDKPDDVKILWDIFEYFLNLVNLTKSESIYEIMQVNLGEPFDIDLHILSTDSHAQGKIREVKLRGYRNIYNNRIERKSIVSVG